MKSSTRFVLPFLLVMGLLCSNVSNAQTFYGGNATTLYQITVTGNSCTWTYIGNYHTATGMSLSASGGLTFCGGTLYMATNDGDLYSVDPATAECTLVMDAPTSNPPLSLQGLTCAGGTFYAIEDNGGQGGGGTIYQYNVSAGTVTSIGSIGTWGRDMIYLNGYLYVISGTGDYIQVDPCNATNNTVLYNTDPLLSMDAIPGDPNNLLYGTYGSIGTMDIATGDQTPLCDAPGAPPLNIYNLASNTQDQPAPDCPPTLDLDANDSSGAPFSNYNAPPYTCLSSGVPIADVDATATSSTPINEMTIEITGILDPPLEVLVLSGSFPNITVSGSGTTSITLTNTSGNATIANFLAALTAILYQDTASPPTAGPRQVTVSFTNANGQTSNQATALVNVQAAPFAPSASITPSSGCTAPDGSIDLTVTPPGSYQYDWSNGATTEDIGGLAPGSYTVTVSPAAPGGCTATSTFEVPGEEEPPTLSLTPTAANCGLSDGAINLTVSDGISPFTFLWSNGATTEDLGNLVAGSYAVTVTGANGCSATTSATVANNNIAIGISGSVLPNTSCAAANGSVVIALSPPNPPSGSYAFAWSNGATTQNLSNLAAGTYAVTVSYGSTCSASATFAVANEPALPVLSTAASAAHCGLPDGTVDLGVTGGLAPYTFVWSNGPTTEDLANVPPGSYAVTVTGANGCTATASATVAAEGIAIGISGSVLPNSSCTAANGSVVISLSPPNPPSGSYTFSWSNGATTQNLSNMAAGTYSVTVSTGDSCSASASFDVVNEPALPSLSTATSPAHCGLSDGTVDLGVAGGEAPFGYLWSNGGNTEDLASLSAGGYSVTVTGANGCTASASATVPSQDIAIGISGSVLPNSSCTVPNGSVDVAPDPPAPPSGNYFFLWSNGLTSQSISGLSAGTYTVSVALGTTCSASASFGVADEPVPPVLSTAASPSNCGLPDGAVDLSASGGEPPFAYLWSNGPASEDLSNLAAGTYLVTVTGSNGCTSSASANVANNNITIGIAADVLHNTACLPPGGDGSVALLLDPPVPPSGSYSFLWSNGQTGQNIGNLPPGTYVVNVLAGATCTATAVFTVADEPIFPVLSALAMPSICGGSDGGIDLVPSGGAFPLSFSWSNGATTEDLANLTSGTYSVIVTGANGCVAALVANVPNNSDSFSVSGTTAAQTACTSPNGGVDLTVSPVGGYAFSWSNGAATEDLGNLAMGTYTVTVSQASACTALASYTVTENLPPSDTSLLLAVSCDPSDVGIYVQDLTGADGCDSTVITTVTLLASDTTAVFGTSCDLNDVGVFEQTLTNGNGCDSLIITTIAYSASDTTAIYGTSCDLNDVGVFEQTLVNSNGCDSLIITTIAYSASDTTNIFDTSCDLNDVGVFEQTLTNGNGCDSLIITTIAYSASDTTAIFDSSCDLNDVGIFQQLLINSNGCDSLIITTIAYSASDTTAIYGTSCNLSDVGIFQQLLTNNNGCDSLIITTVTLLDADTTAIFGTSCNPASVGVFVQNLTNASGCDSTVVTTVAFSLSDTTLLSATTCDPASAGVFTQNLTTPEGCDSTVITTVALMTGSTTFLAATTCDPSATGTFVQNLTGQNGCDSTVTTTVSLLANSETFLTGTTCDPALAGTFVQNLTGQNGCDSTVTTTVSLLPSSETFLTGTTCDPTAAGVFIQNLTGQNGCDSTVTTTVSLLPTDTTYSYSTTCDASQAGTTSVIYPNQNGCDSVVIATTTWTPPPTLAVSTSDFSGFGVTCAGADDGWALASATGTPPFVFNWDNGEALPLLEGLPPGSYLVTATDANGCTSTATATLTSPAPLANSLVINALDCFDNSGGAVTVAGSGGAPPYLYSLDGGPFQPSGTFDGLSAGAYEISVQDANGCTATDLVAINAPVPLSVELGDDVFLELGDGMVLSALTNVPLDSLAQIIWSGTGNLECPGCSAQQVFPVVTTSYSIQVTDGQGCLASDGLTVYVDRRKSVYVPNAFSPNGDGINDLLLVFAKEGQVKSIKSFLVFDRWGESVYRYHDFQPNDPATGWDGTHRGQLLDAAVFVWFAEVEFVDGEVELFEGDVTLVR